MQTEEKESARKSFYEEMIKGETKRFSPKRVKTITTEVLKISPLEAKHILKYYNNTEKTPNRKPSRVVVTKYATDMRNGYWKKTGQTIQFSSEGSLLDGQHRLLAIVETGLPQDFVVVYGVDGGSFDVIDNGKTRSYGDIAAIKGYSDPVLVTSLARAIMAHKSSGEVDADQRQFRSAGANQISKSQVMEFLEENPDIGEYIEPYRKNNIVSPVVAAFCYWMLSNDDAKKAEEYLNQVLLGFDLKPETIQAYVFGKLQRNRNAVQNKMTKTAIISNIVEGYRRFVGYSKNKSIQINWDTRRGIPKLG